MELRGIVALAGTIGASSTDVPVTVDALQAMRPGGDDGFVATFSAP